MSRDARETAWRALTPGDRRRLVARALRAAVLDGEGLHLPLLVEAFGLWQCSVLAWHGPAGPTWRPGLGLRVLGLDPPDPAASWSDHDAALAAGLAALRPVLDSVVEDPGVPFDLTGRAGALSDALRDG